MSTTYRPLRLVAILAAAAVGLGLSSVPSEADHAHPPGRVHAGTEFKWGRAAVDYSFEHGPLSRKRWQTHGRGSVGNQVGMLTLLTDGPGTLTATERTRGRTVGRWETRIRSKRYERGDRDYRVLVELVPAGNRQKYCGARNIALGAYTPYGRSVTHYVRTRPDNQYVMHKRINLADSTWHTLAVEVTRNRVSWFVDAHVVSSERRNAALSGVPFAVRFSLRGESGVRMNETRMQMDWLRYWTLERPNQKSTRAPRPEAGTYAGACAGRG
jgi:hypothetical protein